MKTFSDLSQEYLEYRRSLKISPETIKKNRKSIKMFLNFLKTTFDITMADQLMTEHLHAWQRYLSSKTTKDGHLIKHSTINTYNEGVRVMLKYLSKSGYIYPYLADAVEYVKIPYRLPGNVLTHAQMRKILNKISTNDILGFRDRAMLEVLYSSGIRSGELLNLDIGDIDFRTSTMKVTGKGNKQRVVPIGKRAVRHLETYITAIRPYFVKDPREKAVFLSLRGNRLIHRCLHHRIVAHARNAGFKDVSAHTFRRSCTTEMIKSGANMYHVKEMLGHESLDTLKHYVKLTINDLKKTHAKCHPREKER